MKNSPFMKMDKTFFVLTLILVAIGYIISFSSVRGVLDESASMMFIKYTIFVVLGVLLLFVFINLNYRNFLNYDKLFYIIMCLFIMGVIIGGHLHLGITPSINGSYGWYKIGPLSLQPAEFSKIFMVLVFGSYLYKKSDEEPTFANLLKALSLVVLPAMLVLLEPDLGSAMVYVVIVFIMCLSAKNFKKVHVFALFGGLLFIFIAWVFLHVNFNIPIPLSDYQIDRFTVFINPYGDGANGLGAGYNIIQCLISFGSGGLLGKGFLKGTHFPFIPEHQTDFIVSCIGEEFGLIGIILLLGIFVFFLIKIILIAHDCLDYYGFLICMGFLAMFLFHIVENVGMNMGAMPITGIPLPFISYGGSNLLTNLIACGIILSVSARSRKEI